jgi:LacI family transcriptional regulator
MLPAAVQRRPTSHDVARLAGVSQPTVSRALRDDPRVAPETRARVRAAAAKLGYVPSRRGRSLSTRVTGQIAVVVGDLGNPFYMEAIECLYAAIEELDRLMIVLADRPSRPVEIEHLLDGSNDGAILTTTLLSSELPRELSRRGLPFVLLNRVVDQPKVNACVSENEAGARAMIEELIALGHRDIGAILGPGDTSTSRDREAGMRAALEAAGLELDEERVFRGSQFSYEVGYEGLQRLLEPDDGPVPTAIFCANDVIAIGALNAARACGVAVPEDLTIVGFDDIAMASWDVFSLTTVRQDLPEMARRATRLLDELIADPGARPQRITVPSRLVMRGSHGPPRSGPLRTRRGKRAP